MSHVPTHHVEYNETSCPDKNCMCGGGGEREMTLPNRMSLRPGLLWLTLNLALIIQCLSWNNIYFFKFCGPQVEYHCSIASDGGMIDERWWVRKDLERSGRFLIDVLYRNMTGGTQEKPRKSSIMIADVAAKIRNQKLSHASLACYP
jgi:hypothetical protein